MKRVFVDSGGFFALLVRTDAAHDGARRSFDQADTERWQLVTTNTLIVETYALLLNRTRRGEMLRCLSGPRGSERRTN